MVPTSVLGKGLCLASSCDLLSTSIFGCNFNLLDETPVSVFMSRPQLYVATSNGAFHLKTSCNFITCKDLSCGFIDGSSSRHQSDVATSVIFHWRRDIKVVSRHEDSSFEYFL